MDSSDEVALNPRDDFEMRHLILSLSLVRTPSHSLFIGNVHCGVSRDARSIYSIVHQ
jgi:hypothetical protein